MNKVCARCSIEKNINEFYKHKETSDGYLNFCKECKKEEARKHSSSIKGRINDKNRQNTDKRKKWRAEFQKKYRAKHKKKNLARRIFWNTFRYGTIKKLPCEQCGTEEMVEAHHYDYDKPLDVMWLCGNHHKEWHKTNTPMNEF